MPFVPEFFRGERLRTHMKHGTEINYKKNMESKNTLQCFQR